MMDRLSLNQMTTEQWTLREAVEGCVRHGVPAIGVWRQKVAAEGLAESAKIIRDSGIRVSSLCRGGMFPAATASERLAKIDDNRKAIDEAVELGFEAGGIGMRTGPGPRHCWCPPDGGRWHRGGKNACAEQRRQPWD